MKFRTFIVILLLSFIFVPRVWAADADVRILESDHDSALARIKLMRGAKSELLMSVFNVRDDVVGLSFFAMAREAARAKVDTKILIDGLFFNTHPRLIAHLQNEGVQIRVYNPIKKNFLAQKTGIFTKRMHGKLVIGDGSELITGGRNMGQDYFGIKTVKKNYAWLDRDLYAKGTVVSEAKTAFQELWKEGASPESSSLKGLSAREIEQEGKILDHFAAVTTHYADQYPEFENQLRKVTDIHFMSNFGKRPMIGMNTSDLIELIRSSKRTITIQTPYLFLTNEFSKAILDARNRGVKVVAMVNRDNFKGKNALEDLYGSTHYAQRKRLINEGVELWEDTSSKDIHAKSMVIDGKIAYVGSDNFSPRSADLDFEAGLLVRDEKLAQELESNIHAFKKTSQLATLTNGTAHTKLENCVMQLMKIFMGKTL